MHGFSLVAVSSGYCSLRCVASHCRGVSRGAQALGHTGFSSCGAWAWLLRGMGDLPRPGFEPVSPALAGEFLSTVPPRQSKKGTFKIN